MRYSRRQLLTALGCSLALGPVTGRAVAGSTTSTSWTLEKVSQRLLGSGSRADSGPHFAEASVRSDGAYVVVGVYRGEIGSILVDLQDPADPAERHRIESPSVSTKHADVKFDGREGLYYRTLEEDATGVEVIDYGFETGTPAEPEIRTRIDAGSTHNVVAHPREPVLYTVNESDEQAGLSVWDVADPAAPEHVTYAGVGQDDPDYDGATLHDITVDVDREFAHCAYTGPRQEFFDGYQILDVSDPQAPEEVGRVDYASRPDYTVERFRSGKPGFENCHYADVDPGRGLAVVGDERRLEVPGGKHVFDIGWGDGSPGDPRHVGFVYSPNAALMTEPGDALDWTGHNFDVVGAEEGTVVVSGDYHEGVVVYDLADPTDPTPAATYETDDMAEKAGEPLEFVGEPPMAWGADATAGGDLVVASDMVTGLYVFELTAEGTPVGKE